MSRFYVYMHRLDGEIIYVGSGGEKRPYNLCNRTERYKAKVAGRYSSIKVEIVSKHNLKWKALVAEGRLIRKHAPHCNQVNVNYEFYHLGVSVCNVRLGKFQDAYNAQMVQS